MSNPRLISQNQQKNNTVNNSSFGGSISVDTLAGDSRDTLVRDNTIIPNQSRYRNLEELQKAHEKVHGLEPLESFIVPELKQISENMKKKKFSVLKKADLKDEFD